MNPFGNVVRLRQPDEIDDPLTDVLRSGARRVLAQAVELEAEAFLAGMRELKLPDGRDRLVWHGHGPERLIQTGIGPVAVSRVKIRDRGAASCENRLRHRAAPDADAKALEALLQEVVRARLDPLGERQVQDPCREPEPESVERKVRSRRRRAPAKPEAPAAV